MAAMLDDVYNRVDLHVCMHVIETFLNTFNNYSQVTVKCNYKINGLVGTYIVPKNNLIS
jgi:hypothetical protein